MKRLLYILFIVMLSGCNLKEDDIFNQTPDQRLDAVLQEYGNVLTSAPNGWLLTLTSGVNGGYRMWMTFDANNRVTMLADMDATINVGVATSTVPKESSYRIKAMQTPTLMFDTYGYIHLLSDPEGAVNGGVNGSGLKVDFEYSITKIDNGQFYLKGNFFGSVGFLKAATAAEAQLASKGALNTVHKKFEAYMKGLAYPTVSVKDRKYDLLLGARTSMISYEDDAKMLVKTKVNTYLDLNGAVEGVATSNIEMFEPQTVGGNRFDGFEFNGMGYVATVNGQQHEIFDNGVPCFAMSYGLGRSFTSAKFEYSKLVGTVKDPYISTVYTPAVKGLATDGGRYIDNYTMTFMLNTITMKPVLKFNMVVRNPASPASIYNGVWYYSYTDNGDGTLTFTDRIQGGATNEFRYEPNVRPVLDYLCGVTYTVYSGSWSACVKDVVTPKTFRFDWVKSETVGLKDYLVGYYPTNAGDEANVMVGILSEK